MNKYKVLKAYAEHAVDAIVELDPESDGTKTLLDGDFITVVEEDATETAMGKMLDAVLATVDSACEEKFAEFAVKLDAAGKPNLKVSVGEDRDTQDRTGGFKSAGHFISDVVKAGTPNRTPSETFGAYAKSVQKAISGQDSASGDEGGILIPVEMANTIYKKVFETSALMSRCDVRTLAGNSMTFPAAKEDSRADGSRHAGVTAAWLGEGQQSSVQTLTGLEEKTVKLHKLQVLCAATEELLADAPTAEAWIRDVVSDEISFQAERSIFEGDGFAKPEGFTEANAYISAQTNRTSATVLKGEDIYAMWERLHPSSRANAVWLVGNEVEAPLRRAYDVDVESTPLATWPLMVPPGGISGSPYGSLLGRPVLPCEFCSALNTVDDICLVDLKQYLVATKRGGGAPIVDSQVSIHLLFDYAKTAFRFMFRMDGQSWWPSAVTPYKGTKTTSPFVGLTASA